MDLQQGKHGAHIPLSILEDIVVDMNLNYNSHDVRKAFEDLQKNEVNYNSQNVYNRKLLKICK